MSLFKVPGKQASGVLILDPGASAADLTCHLRAGGLITADGTEIDLGTFCDPQASAKTAGATSFDCEWINSFTDGTLDGLYDLLLPFAGQTVSLEWQPFGAGVNAPKWAFDCYIPAAQVGELRVENASPLATSWGTSNIVYTPATAA